MSFQTLCEEIQSCTLCESVLPMGTNPVFRASPTAKILIAGQAPGIRVHNTSIPFNDPSGDRLRQWMGVSKETFYDPARIAIIPMGFCYPGTGERGDLPPRPECSKTWHPQLLSWLTEIELILPIGIYAQKFYLGKEQQKNLTETVKNWRAYAPKHIPLPHPSPRNNIWLKRNPWFEQDVLPELKLRINRYLN